VTTAGYLSPAPDGTYLEVWAKPRASKSAIAEPREDALTIRLAAPPVDGKANEVLIKFLSKLLKVPKSDLQLVSGLSGRNKRVLVKGLAPEEVSEIICAAH
jgi:uncharacterized protein (TIGR00251 family)